VKNAPHIAQKRLRAEPPAIVKRAPISRRNALPGSEAQNKTARLRTAVGLKARTVQAIHLHFDRALSATRHKTEMAIDVANPRIRPQDFSKLRRESASAKPTADDRRNGSNRRIRREFLRFGHPTARQPPSNQADQHFLRENNARLRKRPQQRCAVQSGAMDIRQPQR
jgi:hypothetical protein